MRETEELLLDCTGSLADDKQTGLPDSLRSPYLPKIVFLISQHVSRRSVQPGAFFTAQSTLFQSHLIIVVQLILYLPILNVLPVHNLFENLPVRSHRSLIPPLKQGADVIAVVIVM